MKVGRLTLTVSQRPATGGVPELTLWRPDVTVAQCAGEAPIERLDRDDVEQLREACDDFLAGRPLAP